MDPETLLGLGKLKALDEAVEDWKWMRDELKKLKSSAEDDLQAKAKKAHWRGENAGITREFVTKTVLEFVDAHGQASTIHNILKDTRAELLGYKEDLEEVLRRAKKDDIYLVKSSEKSFQLDSVVTPMVKPPDQALLDGYAAEIRGILSKATESDRSAADTLRFLADQAKFGFSNARYKNRDEAAEALHAADEAAKLAKLSPADRSPTQLARLNSLAEKYHKDPLFAERFATKVGPEDTLKLWAGVANPQSGDMSPKQVAMAKKFQKNLSLTLASATQSDSPKMQHWEKEMIGLGSRPAGEPAPHSRNFQIMSNLMRFGDYDRKFLNEYGERLIAFDKKNAKAESIRAWTDPTNSDNFNFWGKDDHGKDPMTGFLEGLGHNPEASTEFFKKPAGSEGPVHHQSELNEHLKYLVKDREWEPENLPTGDDKKIPGHNALGHALEAATIGYAHDDPALSGKDADVFKEGGDRRTAATAGVMEQVVALYGGKDGPQLLHDQPGMADSLGKMGGAYVDDINRSLTRSDNDFPSPYPGHARFGNQGAIDFLSVLGQNETSHGYMTSAEHIYTLNALDAKPATSDENYQHGKDAMVAEARARGILDHSRVGQAEATFEAGTEEANSSIGRSAEWGKYAIGTGISAGVALIPVPGSTGAALTVAPIAADAGGELLNTFLGQQIDQATEDGEKDPAEDTQMTSRELYRKGEQGLYATHDQYLAGHHAARDQADRDDLQEDLRNAYIGSGSNTNQYRGRPAVPND
ncbi:hypothetical protein [Streptomyces axinellae]|uniref:PPE domain-containing protein n=1 Tax=Streptomyces axinellae TaxID=552788 RepID=A0ABP6CL33_9ACTN